MIRIVRDFGHRISQLAWQSRVAIKINVRRLAFVIVQLRDEVLSILGGVSCQNCKCTYTLRAVLPRPYI